MAREGPASAGGPRGDRRRCGRNIPTSRLVARLTKRRKQRNATRPLPACCIVASVQALVARQVSRSGFPRLVRGSASSVVPLRGKGSASPFGFPWVPRGAGFAPRMLVRVFSSGPKVTKGGVEAGSKRYLLSWEGVGRGCVLGDPRSAGPRGVGRVGGLWPPRSAGLGRRARDHRRMGSSGRLAGCAGAPPPFPSLRGSGKGAPAAAGRVSSRSISTRSPIPARPGEERQTDRQTDRQTERQAGRQRQTDRQTVEHPGRQTDSRIDSQLKRQTNKQTDRQTEMHAHAYVHLYV